MLAAQMKQLAEHVLRVCDPAQAAATTVDDAIQFLVPKLLSKGLVAPSVEGKGFSLGVSRYYACIWSHYTSALTDNALSRMLNLSLSLSLSHTLPLSLPLSLSFTHSYAPSLFVSFWPTQQALSRVVKAARGALQGWRAPLISVLVESMSAFEPGMLQYMQFHTARLQISDEELEQVGDRG